MTFWIFIYVFPAKWYFTFSLKEVIFWTNRSEMFGPISLWYKLMENVKSPFLTKVAQDFSCLRSHLGLLQWSLVLIKMLLDSIWLFILKMFVNYVSYICCITSWIYIFLKGQEEALLGKSLVATIKQLDLAVSHQKVVLILCRRLKASLCVSFEGQLPVQR